MAQGVCQLSSDACGRCRSSLLFDNFSLSISGLSHVGAVRGPCWKVASMAFQCSALKFTHFKVEIPGWPVQNPDRLYARVGSCSMTPSHPTVPQPIPLNPAGPVAPGARPRIWAMGIRGDG